MHEPIDPGLPTARFPFPAYPDGWARVGLTEELAPGDVQAIRYFGRDLVLFRTESGRACVLDAHCRHLGAHLGVGGAVDGEGIRCPFHHWCWSPEGRCTDIPYAKRIPPGAQMRAWPVCERNGFVFLWYHPEAEAPSDEVPEIPEYTDPRWSPYRRLRWKIRSRSYDMGENAVDDVHFRYLHGAASMPKTTKGDVRGSHSNLSKMSLDTPQGKIEGSIESTSVPGMGLVYVRGICDTLIVITGTPIDGDYVDQMFSYKQKVGQDEGRERLAAALLRDLEKQMNEDVLVFEHKKHWSQPLLVPEDGPIADYRRRAKAQYTGDFQSPDDERSGADPPAARARGDGSGFGEREFDELASHLRSAFRVRRVERADKVDGGVVEFLLFGVEPEPRFAISFEKSGLDRFEVADLRGCLSRPQMRARIREAGPGGVFIATSEIPG